MVDEETRCRCFSRSFLPTAGRRCFSRSVSADKALEGWLMVTKKLLLEMMDIFMFKEKKGGPRPVRSRCRELVTMCYLAWLQRKLAKEAVASASAHTFTHWGVKCGGEEGEAKAAL